MEIKIKHRPLQSGEGSIRIIFYLNRDRVVVHTECYCKAQHWNAEKMRVSSADKFAKDKNLVIEQKLARVNDVLVRFRLKNKELTRDRFYKAYNRPDDYDNFFAFTEEQKKLNAKRLEDSTITVHTSVLNKLEEFRPELHFDDITTDFLVEFFSHMIKKLGNNENTAFKNMTVLKKYVNQAIKAGYMDENPYEDFPIRKVKGNCVYLTDKELNKLIEAYKKGDLDVNQYKALQLFLYMCFSSQHIGDAKKMQLEQFGETTYTYYRIKNKNRKPDPIHVPISSSLKQIIKDIAGNRKRGPLFENLPTEQKMNVWIKDIAKDNGIEKQISHKSGRHTFATIFLRHTKDLNALKDILGHSDFKETLVYAHVLDEDKQQGIACFDGFLKSETNTKPQRKRALGNYTFCGAMQKQ